MGSTRRKDVAAAGPTRLELLQRTPRSLNVRREVQHLKQNPLEPLLLRLGAERKYPWVLDDAADRFRSKYRIYVLSAERTLRAASIQTRYRHGPSIARKVGMPFTPSMLRLAKEVSRAGKFAELDLFSTMMHCRTMIDEIPELAQPMFVGMASKPPFRSFSRHKEFFIQRQDSEFGALSSYATYIRTKTSWFDVLKEVRDTFVVHRAPSHLRMFVVGTRRGWDYGVFLTFEDRYRKGGLAVLTIVALVDAVHEFLRWFNEYAMAVLGPSTVPIRVKTARSRDG